MLTAPAAAITAKNQMSVAAALSRMGRKSPRAKNDVTINHAP